MVFDQVFETHFHSVFYSCFVEEFLDFENFLEVLHKVQRWRDTPDEILDAFMTFDDNKNGLLPTTLLYEMLTSRGEQPMTSKEVKQMIEHVPVNNMGEIDYRGRSSEKNVRYSSCIRSEIIH